jgi:methionyl-tRNA formyltransferase
VTYASKISKEEMRVDWRQTSVEIHNRIRGLSPSPAAWCEMTIAGRAERIRLLRSEPAEAEGAPGEITDDRLTVACGEGGVRITELQRSGGKPVTAEEFLRGARIRKGERLA